MESSSEILKSEENGVQDVEASPFIRKQDPAQKAIDFFIQEIKATVGRKKHHNRTTTASKNGNSVSQISSYFTEVRSDVNEVESSSDDTDLELDQHKEPPILTAPKEYYTRLCKKNNVPVCSQFVYQIVELTLNLANLSLVCKELVPICETLLMKCSSITSLNLSGNCFGTSGVVLLLHTLKRLPALVELDLSNNSLRTAGTKLVSQFMTNHRIQILNLSYNNIEETDAHLVADIILNSSYLQNLKVSNNNLGCTGGILIGKALADNDTLICLNLSWNNIRLKGAREIASGLKENSTLRNIDLGWNGFSDDGAVAISETLKFNDVLTYLDLSSNRINFDGAVALAKALAINESLKEIKLTNNNITSLGIEMLVVGIKKNPNSKVTQIELKNCAMKFTSAAMLADCDRPPLIKCRTFIRSHDNLGITDDVFDAAAKANPKALPVQLVDVYEQFQELQILKKIKTSINNDTIQFVTKSDILRILKGLQLPLKEEELNQMVTDMFSEGIEALNLDEIEKYFVQRNKLAVSHTVYGVEINAIGSK